MDTLRQRIGQLFLVGCQGESLSNQERLLIEEYQFAGLILFQRNCAKPGQLVALCRAVWEAFDALPPFIAIDQEGGRVHRLPAGIGARNDPDLAYRLGKATAAELSLAGINLNFAPVLDVRSHPGSSIIGDRSFATEPKRVSAIAGAWIHTSTCR
jgi:beta-N-acetylhexosaminidase